MPVLYFDGVCNLCNWVVLFVIKRDKKKSFKFASLQSAYCQKVMEQLHLKSDFYETFILSRNNKFYFKSTAVLYVLKDLRGLWQLAYIFIIIPKFIRDFLYTIVSKTRYTVFGKQKKCFLPTSDISDRFLE